MEVSRLFDSPEARFGAAGPLFVAHYKGAVTLATLEKLDELQGALVEKRGTISMITVIGELGPMFKIDEDVRHRSVELGKKYDKQVRGGAIVVTTRGLAAVMVRTFLSGFFLLSRNEMPMRTFATVKEALSWLQNLPGQDAPLRELRPTDIDAFITRE
ncbi:MAG: STAS/SEC14 domain-containing protein [Archangium sp.]